VGPRAGLDDEKRKFLTLPGLELRLVRSQSLHRLWFKKKLLIVSHKNVLRVESSVRDMLNAILLSTRHVSVCVSFDTVRAKKKTIGFWYAYISELGLS
jgi:hypothetical protein